MEMKMIDSEKEKLKEAVYEFIDALAKSWHLYKLLDWFTERLKSRL